MINSPIIYKFLKDFMNHRKKTNWVVVFSCRPFPDKGPSMRPFNSLENKALQTHIEEFS